VKAGICLTLFQIVTKWCNVELASSQNAYQL